MGPLCYRRHRFPPEIIQHANWLYLRFTLSYRDVEELLAVRGLDISYETVRRWVLKFGPAIVRGPSKPAVRGRLQTTASCDGKEPWLVSVAEKAGPDPVR
jgi:transposase-like protein